MYKYNFLFKVLHPLLRSSFVWTLLNLLFFNVLAFGFLMEPQPKLLGEGWRFPEFFPVDGGAVTLAVYIFIFNLSVSAFLVVTLPGLALFIFPTVFLVLRAYHWGVMLSNFPTSVLLAALPTILFEGEAYVVAGVAGTNLGLSWLKPKWVYGDLAVSRREAFKIASKECASLYILVAILLFIAAIIETVTIHQIASV